MKIKEYLEKIKTGRSYMLFESRWFVKKVRNRKPTFVVYEKDKPPRRYQEKRFAELYGHEINLGDI